MSRPLDLDEDSVRAAAEGRSEEVIGPRRPVALNENEVRTAAEGRFEQILATREKKTR